MRKLQLPDSAALIAEGRRNAPSAERNLAPILAVLAEALPDSGAALEIASGTGQHIAAFGERFPHIRWQPSDGNPANLGSIAAWCEGQANILPPQVLDACKTGWAQAWRRDHRALTSIHLTNLLHLISTPEAETLLEEVAQALAPEGVFCLYGPFKRGGALVSEGDRAFDASLRAQDPAIGYKDIEWVQERLRSAGLQTIELIEMPADNLMLLARRPLSA
ncbi:DUF938 domain-containing protein [Pararhodobacter oceanensis]|uniref:Methyltransferase n=1 Tax=Pararhodobacter oceanensis TaxID=2172121 RepID=A0A2T8HX89_9RHOB|nr:DUF938 domain-containing protein [Pararhodobacter oceanensis]PVH30047.1 methyltransferase [Pararhodobacter oceanensis]